MTRARTRVGWTVAALGAWLFIMSPQMSVAGDPVFLDDFESIPEFAFWDGRQCCGHSAIRTVDPFDASNHVLCFTQLTHRYGDIFSPEIAVERGTRYSLSFDFLGIPALGGRAGDLGGFVGYSDDLEPTHATWLAGTELVHGAFVELADDGVWHHYEIVFDPYALFDPAGDRIRLHFQDYIFSRGVPRDVCFDNIRLEPFDTIAIDGRSWASLKTLYR